MKKMLFVLACAASLFLAVSCSDKNDDIDVTLHEERTEFVNYGDLVVVYENGDKNTSSGATVSWEKDTVSNGISYRIRGNMDSLYVVGAGGKCYYDGKELTVKGSLSGDFTITGFPSSSNPYTTSYESVSFDKY